MATILVVDDEHGLAEVMAVALSDAGYRVRIAGNGLQALQRMQELRPDLVLLDYMLPLLDGPGVLGAMCADAKLAATPVIVISSLPESVVRRKCDGYAGFLRKPFTFQELLSAVDRTLGK